MACQIPADVAAFIGEHADFETYEINAVFKVRCTTTNHEMLPELSLCTAHLESKSYKKAVRRKGLEVHDFKQYEPNIVPHRTDPYLLFCALTGKMLMKDPTAVANHVNKKSYKVRALCLPTHPPTHPHHREAATDAHPLIYALYDGA
jgi:hypothetical protein